MRRLNLSLALVLVAGVANAQLKTFSDKTVAGTDKDLMIIRHLVIRGSNVEIGKKLAQIAKDQHRVRLGSWPDAASGAKQIKWLTANYPERMERAKGLEEFFKVDPSNVDVTSLPIDLSMEPMCSVVFYPGANVSNGHAMISRNYDFPKASYSQLTRRPEVKGERSMTGDPYVIEMHPDHGYASLYTCAYDLLGGAIDGVNEKGVSVALLADDMSQTRTRGNGFGLSEVDLPRFVLDECASAAEARQKLKDVPYYATFTPCHYIIGDATGDSFIFEVGGDGKHYIIDGGHKPQIITNHSIAEYGTANLPQGNSFDRYRRLQEELAKRNNKFTPTEVKEINYCVAVPTQARVAATMWHAVYDLTDRSVIISFCLSRADETDERRTPYLSFKLGN